MKDKNLLKIAGIISIVVGIIECITIVGAIVGIPTIIGGYKLNTLSDSDDATIIREKEAILVWGIILIILNTISGVLTLIYYYGLENDNKSKNNNSNKYDDLEKLNKLYNEKAITKEEFEKEKARILN